MDAATLLEQYTQDLSNLPQELTYLLGELREKDMKYYETRKRIQQRDAQLHKYIKQHGSLVKHPKEHQIYSKIKEDFEKASKIQDEKCILANTALFLLAKHLARLEKDIGRLETSGMIPHLLDDNEIEMMDVDQDINMGVTNLTQRLTSTTIDSNRKIKHPKKISRSGTPILSDSISSERSTPSSNDIVVPLKKKREESIIGGGLVKNSINSRKKFENIPGSVNLPKSMGGTGNNEDDELYCFCQQVSYGAMVACDNPQCKYEWFHYDCVGLQEPPQGIWFCPDCRKSDNKKDDKKKDRKKRN